MRQQHTLEHQLIIMSDARSQPRRFFLEPTVRKVAQRDRAVARRPPLAVYRMRSVAVGRLPLAIGDFGLAPREQTAGLRLRTAALHVLAMIRSGITNPPFIRALRTLEQSPVLI